MNWSRNQLLGIIIVLAVIVFYGGYNYSQKKVEAKDHVLIVHNADEQKKIDSASEVEESHIFIHITGEVEKPGLYQLPEGARVNDGIEKAKATEEADLDALNLAQILFDGTKIIVPAKGQELTNGDQVLTITSVNNDGLVNINTANTQELADKLPGVGPVIGQRIVDYREKNGPFKAKEDIINVSGIGSKTYENIKDIIFVK